jgi:hypothetical protein
MPMPMSRYNNFFLFSFFQVRKKRVGGREALQEFLAHSLKRRAQFHFFKAKSYSRLIKTVFNYIPAKLGCSS